MPSVELDHDESTEATADPLISPGSPCISDIYGDPQVLPRVGDQYQVDVPPIMIELDSFQLMQTPTPMSETIDVDYCMHTGLAIPIVWVQNEIIRGVSEASKPKVDIFYDVSAQGKILERSEIHELVATVDQTNANVLNPQQQKSYLDQQPEVNDFSPTGNFESRSWHLVPGCLGDPWSEIEQESFLLGLYIFGKNLVHVKKFMDSKNMGDMLSFYYGKFYRSERHRRWSECRKIRSRRCIHGQRIFTGWRQQELLSRLLPYIPEESRDAILEVSKTFGEGKVSLEEYVSMLKTTVGLCKLVEVIGIGKGKHDLTGIVMEPIKTNQVSLVRSEIPIGKACSSLTSSDIIKFLTGDFRLSKARSNDLFWEAVWPRLLARGWHSEQPKNHGYVVSKNTLVFLIPGIKKFSRRKIVKGIQYFDSVSDVLNKVASDPGLLDLEVEAAKGNKVKEEYAWEADTKLEQNGSSNNHLHCYLRPKHPNCNSDDIKFTVVDTSLVCRKEPFKVRELRSLPVNSSGTYSPASPSRETDGDSSEGLVDEPVMQQIDREESYPVMCNDDKLEKSVKSLPDKEMQSDLLESVIPDSQKGLAIDEPDSVAISTANLGGAYPVMPNGKRPGKEIKCQFSCRTKSGRTNYLSPISKRRRLNTCSLAKSNQVTDASSTGPQLKEEDCSCQSNSCEASLIKATKVGPSQQVEGSPDEKTECVYRENFFGTSTVSETGLSFRQEKPRPLIDLNLPHVPPDFDADEVFTEAADSLDDLNIKQARFSSDLNQQPEESHLLEIPNAMPSTQPTAINARRQSTRNRPLTTRALEALECWFLNTKRRGRGTKALSRENSMSRSTQQAHEGVRVSVPVKTLSSGSGRTNVTDSRVEFFDECSSNMDMVGMSQVRSERIGNHGLLGVSKTVYQPEILTGKDGQSG